MVVHPGDTITIAGVMCKVSNPSRRWWQFWKPRMVDSGELKSFVVNPPLTKSP